MVKLKRYAKGYEAQNIHTMCNTVWSYEQYLIGVNYEGYLGDCTVYVLNLKTGKRAKHEQVTLKDVRNDPEVMEWMIDATK